MSEYFVPHVMLSPCYLICPRATLHSKKVTFSSLATHPVRYVEPLLTLPTVLLT